MCPYTQRTSRWTMGRKPDSTSSLTIIEWPWLKHFHELDHRYKAKKFDKNFSLNSSEHKLCLVFGYKDNKRIFLTADKYSSSKCKKSVCHLIACSYTRHIYMISFAGDRFRNRCSWTRFKSGFTITGLWQGCTTRFIERSQIQRYWYVCFLTDVMPKVKDVIN